MEKGTRLITKNGKTTLRIAGRWGSDIVLEDTTPGSEEIRIYDELELENLISEGRYIRLNSIGEPIR